MFLNSGPIWYKKTSHQAHIVFKVDTFMETDVAYLDHVMPEFEGEKMIFELPKDKKHSFKHKYQRQNNWIWTPFSQWLLSNAHCSGMFSRGLIIVTLVTMGTFNYIVIPHLYKRSAGDLRPSLTCFTYLPVNFLPTHQSYCCCAELSIQPSVRVESTTCDLD